MPASTEPELATYIVETIDGVFRTNVPADARVETTLPTNSSGYPGALMLKFIDASTNSELIGYSGVISYRRSSVAVQQLSVEDVNDEESGSTWSDIRDDWPLSRTARSNMREEQMYRERRTNGQTASPSLPFD